MSSHEQPGAPDAAVTSICTWCTKSLRRRLFDGLRERGLKVRRPDLTIATADHSIPTTTARCPSSTRSPQRSSTSSRPTAATSASAASGSHSDKQGIVHVIGPELGLTQPGMTVVCGDSHTATHGAFGALAFGIGTSEVEHVLATQCLLQRQSKTFEVRVDGTLKPGVSAQGHHSGADRADRHRRRHRLRVRVHAAPPSARSRWKSA